MGRQENMDKSLGSSINAKRGLTQKDVSFLDTWVASLSQEERAEIEDKTWAEVARNKPLGRQKSPRVRKSISSPGLSGGTSTMTNSSMTSSMASFSYCST